MSSHDCDAASRHQAFSPLSGHLLLPDDNISKTLALRSQARFNEIGVQHLSSHVHQQIFPDGCQPPSQELVALARDHLQRHDLLGKNTDSGDPIAFDLPALQGRTLDEHFHKLGVDCAEPFLGLSKSGWVKYLADGSSEPVSAPQEDMLCFDTEVMWKESPFAVMACAASPTAWYMWLSPWLLGESESPRHLVPLGDPTKDKVIVGHNVGYDRARILEEYDLKQSRNSFIDTMSLHVAVNGMCSQQRPTWMKHKKNREVRERIASQTEDLALAELLTNSAMRHEEEELWVERSSINSLRDVAKFHLNVTIDKAIRDDFGELDRAGVLGKLDELLDYCAADVAITHRVYQVVFPNFLETCPHPVSFAALRHLSSVILPVNKSWEKYIASAEAEDAQKWSTDPWLKQLDWSGQEIKMVKGKKKGDPPRPAARQKKPGMPRWYKDLFASNEAPINLSVRTRIAPLLLRLAWDGHPLVWSDTYGWTFRVQHKEASKYLNKQMVQCDFSEEKIEALRNDIDGIYFKLPHKDGPTARCANPLAKGYLNYFETGTLSSEYTYAKEALEMNASCSYWISARDRIRSQMVVYQSDFEGYGAKHAQEDEYGFILPQIIPMGTITRRAVENTWLTASNAKKNRVGSELKAMVKAPPGYSFVAAGTDLHSRTASILGISRNDAKVFNYGRIYGAGLKFAATLLRQFNPSLSEQETVEIASKLYATTKGTRTNRKVLYKRPFWRGGTESFVFNALEEFAEQERPRTPVLGAGITEALMSRYINKGGYLTSRINWAIQSSGQDYLHLLVVSMDYLTRRYNIDARLAITVHDEIRYLVKDHDRYRAAMALQVANLWTRAMFSQQIGINDLPQSVAFFSAVDIDHVLRKEVDMDCVTPSHADPIPHGESIDIVRLLEKGPEALLDPAIVPERHAPKLDGIAYAPRAPVMGSLQKDVKDPVAFIKAQITADDDELKGLVKAQKKPPTPASSGGRRGRPVSLKGVLPYYSQAKLMPTDEPISVGEAMGARYKNAYQKGKPEWSRGPKKSTSTHAYAWDL
ncbi:unnamed protein product [Parascedosporium putredinis]|uniref:DNA-directed DNA polymerase n=1 Tax=Parascedosporium putredinis TaxID=1442378 RepID=A0A9P1MDQ3_9PEZI|nr:unnamed protein product [Parascedosporium putredinis]CAI8003072.1 unnamed protein product [Parascedosporium putredinis]